MAPGNRGTATRRVRTGNMVGPQPPRLTRENGPAPQQGPVGLDRKTDGFRTAVTFHNINPGTL